MNIADSERYSSILKNSGFEETDSQSDSDIVLVNTCVVRGKAEERAISFFSELETLRRVKPGLRFILAGCLSPRVKILELKKRFPGLLFAINPSEIDSFDEYLRKHLDEIGSLSIEKEIISPEKTGLAEPETTAFRYHAYVTVMRGCEQNCTYCIVPFSRGAIFSRPTDEILDEVQQRIDEGAKAITLLGQSILDYGKDWNNDKPIKSIDGDDLFRQLLDTVSLRFPEIWIKFLTSHPKDFTFETVDLIASRENITRFIHLPVQSGDDNILKKMSRGHTSDEFFKLIEYIESKIPDVRLSSDIIVGFPGETQASFEHSLELLKRARLFKVFTFQYSPRPETPALKFPDDVPFDEKRLRLNRLIDLQNQITRERHMELEGSEIVAMVEGKAKGDDGSIMARSRDEDIVIFKSNRQLESGDLVRLKIIEGKLRTLKGEIIEKID